MVLNSLTEVKEYIHTINLCSQLGFQVVITVCTDQLTRKIFICILDKVCLSTCLTVLPLELLYCSRIPYKDQEENLLIWGCGNDRVAGFMETIVKNIMKAAKQEITYKDMLFTTQDNHLRRQSLLISAQQLGRFSTLCVTCKPKSWKHGFPCIVLPWRNVCPAIFKHYVCLNCLNNEWCVKTSLSSDWHEVCRTAVVTEIQIPCLLAHQVAEQVNYKKYLIYLTCCISQWGEG